MDRVVSPMPTPLGLYPLTCPARELTAFREFGMPVLNAHYPRHISGVPVHPIIS